MYPLTHKHIWLLVAFSLCIYSSLLTSCSKLHLNRAETPRMRYLLLKKKNSLHSLRAWRLMQW